MTHELILWLGQRFSPEQYLFWTRIQCIAWTAADLVIIFYLIRIANLARHMLGIPPHRIPFAILAATALAAPLLLVPQTGWRIFALEILITAPHFALILFTITANVRILADALVFVLERPAA